MNTIVPLISSGTAGPLGVLHLPRLWQKLSLEASGKLASGYPGAGQGYDQMVIDGLGLDREAVIQFISTNKPSYPQFEAWVKTHATQLGQDSVAALNAAITGYHHDDATRKSICSACDIPDDDNAPRDAIHLNNLDDWQEFYSSVLKA